MTVLFIISKDFKEKIRRNKMHGLMTHNQVVPGSSPGGPTTLISN